MCECGAMRDVREEPAVVVLIVRRKERFKHRHGKSTRSFPQLFEIISVNRIRKIYVDFFSYYGYDSWIKFLFSSYQVFLGSSLTSGPEVLASSWSEDIRHAEELSSDRAWYLRLSNIDDLAYRVRAVTHECRPRPPRLSSLSSHRSCPTFLRLLCAVPICRLPAHISDSQDRNKAAPRPKQLRMEPP